MVPILFFETLKTLKLPPFLRISPKPASLDHAIPVKAGIAGKRRLYEMATTHEGFRKAGIWGQKTLKKTKRKI